MKAQNFFPWIVYITILATFLYGGAASVFGQNERNPAWAREVDSLLTVLMGKNAEIAELKDLQKQVYSADMNPLFLSLPDEKKPEIEFFITGTILLSQIEGRVQSALAKKGAFVKVIQGEQKFKLDPNNIGNYQGGNLSLDSKSGEMYIDVLFLVGNENEKVSITLRFYEVPKFGTDGKSTSEKVFSLKNNDIVTIDTKFYRLNYEDASDSEDKKVESQGVYLVIRCGGQLIPSVIISNAN